MPASFDARVNLSSRACDPLHSFSVAVGENGGQHIAMEVTHGSRSRRRHIDVRLFSASEDMASV